MAGDSENVRQGSLVKGRAELESDPPTHVVWKRRKELSFTEIKRLFHMMLLGVRL